MYETSGTLRKNTMAIKNRIFLKKTNKANSIVYEETRSERKKKSEN